MKLQPGLPAIGTQVDGRYELLDLLGKGGFGAVYLARQISMDRNVALKILLSQALNMDEMVQRFKREVMAIRNLSHPNTIQIYDFNKSSGGFLYYAMEAVKGPTLKEVIKTDGPISPERVKRICRQILKSLSEAHASRIVHRDLKPANIMLAEMHGEVDFVKVLDFGIAKLLDTEDGEEELTNAGVLIGTISYMSPEQISSKNIGATTDIYALGLIGIEMLSGQSVFAKSGKWEILNKQISSDPIDVPEFIKNDPIGQLFVKAVSKNPAERFQNAVEMIRAFDETQAKTTPLAQRGWSDSLPKKGIKASSISQSGPISVSGIQTPSPTPIFNVVSESFALDELPTMISDSNIILESHSQQLSQETHSALLTNEFEAPDKKPLVAVIAFVGVAALCLLLGFVFIGGEEEMKSEPLPTKTKEVVADTKNSPPLQEIKKVERAEETEIALSGPTGAEIYSEDNLFLGILPRPVFVSKPTTFRIQAEGFLTKNIVLSPSSSSKMEVLMDAEKSKTAKKVRRPKNSIRPKQKNKKPRTIKVTKPTESTKPTQVKKPRKPSNGWAPIKKKVKVKAWD